MKIEIWSDFLCPYCLLGKGRLMNALDKAGIQADIEMKSFLLNPEAPLGTGQPMGEHLMEKYGMGPEDVADSFETLTAMGQLLGLNLQMDAAKSANTNQAHALFQYAKTRGLGTQLSDRFQLAGFVEGRVLDDVDTLVELAGQVGIRPDEVQAALADPENFAKAEAENQVAIGYGARGVPFFVLAGRLALSGAQGEGVFLNALQQAARQEQGEGAGS